MTNAKGEKRQELRWESAIDDAIPFARPTNPTNGQLFYDNQAEQLSIWNGNAVVGSSSASSGGTTSTISYQNLSLVGTKLGCWDITENVRTNLEKVEELYLHTIKQQKQLGAQQEQLEAQQKEIETLKAMIKYLMEKKETFNRSFRLAHFD